MKPLETERVRKLVRSAVRFSSGELYDAVNQLKDMAQNRASEERTQNLKAWIRSLQPGDPIILSVNGHSVPYGTPGVVEATRIVRSKNVGCVWAYFGPQYGTKCFWARHVGKLGSVSQLTIETNRATARILGGVFGKGR